MGYEAKSSVLGAFHRSCSLIYRAFSIFVIVSLVFLTSLIFYQVIMRDLFNIPPTWTEELALVIMIYLAIVGSGWGIRDNIHIYFELVVSKLPGKVRRITELLAHQLLLPVTPLVRVIKITSWAFPVGYLDLNNAPTT